MERLMVGTCPPLPTMSMLALTEWSFNFLKSLLQWNPVIAKPLFVHSLRILSRTCFVCIISFLVTKSTVKYFIFLDFVGKKHKPLLKKWSKSSLSYRFRNNSSYGTHNLLIFLRFLDWFFVVLPLLISMLGPNVSSACNKSSPVKGQLLIWLSCISSIEILVVSHPNRSCKCLAFLAVFTFFYYNIACYLVQLIKNARAYVGQVVIINVFSRCVKKEKVIFPLRKHIYFILFTFMLHMYAALFICIHRDSVFAYLIYKTVGLAKYSP